MKPQRRFIKSIVATAKACDKQMPWERGSARAAMIARRDAKAAPVLKRA